MQFTYVIDHAQPVIRIRVGGALSLPEFLTTYQQLREDPAFDGSYPVVTDLTDVTAVDAAWDEIRVGAHSVVSEFRVRRAVVAPSDFQYGIARMFATFAEGVGQDVRVFRDATAAEEWVAG